jgi:ABC-2 type transport system ATP-binding protein
LKKLTELPTDDRAHAFEVVSDKEQDLRPEIFQLAAEKGWVLLELHRDQQTLEDVFRSLTIGEERRNRQLSATPVNDDDEDDEDEDEDDDGSAPSGDAEEKAAKADRS